MFYVALQWAKYRRRDPAARGFVLHTEDGARLFAGDGDEIVAVDTKDEAFCLANAFDVMAVNAAWNLDLEADWERAARILENARRESRTKVVQG